MTRARPIVFILFLLCAFMSCSAKRKIEQLTLPSTEILTANNVWLVVSAPYVSIRDTPYGDGITVKHARRGEIFSVYGQKTADSGAAIGIWYLLEDGWIPASAAQLYQFELQAQNAARLLKQ